MNRHINFVTITYARSGSSFLQCCLGSHVDIGAVQEMLINADKRGINVKKVMDRFYFEDTRPKVLGFKLMYNHTTDEIVAYLLKYKIKIIQLIRNDLLETVLWLPWCFKGKKDGGMGPPLHILEKGEADIENVIHWISWLRNQIDKYKRIAQYTVWYSELTGDKDSRVFYNQVARIRLLKFLQVDTTVNIGSAQNKKNTRQSNEKLITNYGELLQEMKKEGILQYYV